MGNDNIPDVTYTVTQRELDEDPYLGNFTATATPLGMLSPQGLSTWDCAVTYDEAADCLVVSNFAGMQGLSLLLDLWDIDDIELGSNTLIAYTPQNKPISQCVFTISNGLPDKPEPYSYAVEWNAVSKTYTFDLEGMYLGMLVIDGATRTPVTDAYSSLVLTKK